MQRTGTEVTLPVDPNTFRDFVAAILGKPQTITQLIFGTFELKVDDLLNLFRLIDQRVTQQNTASLIQFSTKIIYSDNSTRLLSTFEELNSFAEPRDVIPLSVHLQISYLIKFNDPRSEDGLGKPEKQEIEISIATSGLRKYRTVNFESVNIFPFDTEGYFELIVKHTAITWGSDIISLLSQHVQTLLIEESRVKKYIRRHSTGIGLSIGGLFFLICIAFTIINVNLINSAQKETIMSLMDVNKGSSVEAMNNKLNFIIESGFVGSDNNQALIVTLFLLFSFIVSIVLTVWIGASAEHFQPSYLLLTRASENNKKMTDTKERRKWRSFILAVLSTIIIGVITNYIFALLCAKNVFKF